MGNRPAVITRREREAHFKAARAAGYTSAEIEITPDGTIRFYAGDQKQTTQTTRKNKWDEKLNGTSS